jgi:hypothetical protein
VVIKYQETPIAPVPVYAPGGGCEEKVCEHSRVREGYCIELLKEKDLCDYCKPPKIEKEKGPCQSLQNSDNDNEAKRKFLCEELLMPCPGDCCDDPCVVLGSITFTGNTRLEDGITAQMINNWDLRKLVITPGLIEHWMTKWAPKKVPFESIVDYASLGEKCKNPGMAVEGFFEMCQEEETNREEETELKNNEDGDTDIKKAVVTEKKIVGRSVRKEKKAKK